MNGLVLQHKKSWAGVFLFFKKKLKIQLFLRIIDICLLNYSYKINDLNNNVSNSSKLLIYSILIIT